MNPRTNAVAALVAAAAFAVYEATSSHGVSWALGVSDSGELAAAAHVLGVPHPTGYPLYMLLGWLVSNAPLGADPASRLTALSAICGALACGLACLLVAALASGDDHSGLPPPVRRARAPRPTGPATGSDRPEWTLLVGPLCGGAACAGLSSLWRQSTAPETRPLAMCLVLGALLLLLQACRRRDRGLLIWSWAVWGFALADHLLCLALLPALAIGTVVLSLDRGSATDAAAPPIPSPDADHGLEEPAPAPGITMDGPQAPAAGSLPTTPHPRPTAAGTPAGPDPAMLPPLEAAVPAAGPDPAILRPQSDLALPCDRSRRFALCAPLAILPGLCLYAYLPLRAGAHPSLDWGDPETPGRFLDTITGSQYSDLMGVPMPDLGARLIDRLGDMGSVLGAPLAAAALLGALLLAWRSRTAAALLAAVWLTALLQSSLYAAGSAPVYLLPAEVVACLCAGYAAGCLPPLLRGRAARIAGVALLAGLAALTAAHDVSDVQSLQAGVHDQDVTAFARAALTGLPDRSLVVVSGDEDTFALWYAQFGLGLRADVAVVNVDLLAWHWYRDDLRHGYPWLQWGPPWQPDGAADEVTRSTDREDALVRAMAGYRPIYFTSLMDIPVQICAPHGIANLFQCVPEAGQFVPTATASMPAPGRPRGRVRIAIQPIAKVIGDASQAPAGVLRQNGGLDNVTGADLGYPALYRGRWYLAFGDTAYDAGKVGQFPFFPNIDAPSNFVVATSASSDLDGGLPFSGYLNTRPAYMSKASAPFRAIAGHADQYTLPGGLYTVRYRGRETLIAQYMLDGNAGGDLHWAERSTIAVFDPADGMFHDWKAAVYDWHAAAGSHSQYDFGNSVFWEDGAERYLYMVGAGTDRFGGAKIARIPVASFLDPRDHAGWSYWLGGSWSAPTVDEGAIARSVAWLIPPRDPAWSPGKSYANDPHRCADMGIGEFSLVWNAYLGRFLLLTGTGSCGSSDLRIYQAASPAGPWTASPAQILAAGDAGQGGAGRRPVRPLQHGRDGGERRADDLLPPVDVRRLRRLPVQGHALGVAGGASDLPEIGLHRRKDGSARGDRGRGETYLHLRKDGSARGDCGRG